MDRFTMEEAIMSMYNIADDVKFIMEKHIDSKEFTPDELFNILYGVAELHFAKVANLMDMFETFVKQGIITNSTVKYK